jgi:hypothetical protein
LLQAFIMIVTEYAPLRNALVPIVAHAGAILESSAQRAAEHQAQMEKEEEDDDGLDNHDNDGAVPTPGKPETE